MRYYRLDKMLGIRLYLSNMFYEEELKLRSMMIKSNFSQTNDIKKTSAIYHIMPEIMLRK